MTQPTEKVQYSDVLAKLSDVLDRIAPATNGDLTDEQKHVVLIFRALRNGLGNFGRHGQRFDSALMPSPRISPSPRGEDQYVLTFFEPTLPSGTRHITLHHTGRPPTRYDINCVDEEYWDMEISAVPVALVEATGTHQTPLVVGRPFTGPITARRSHPTTVTGKKKTYEITSQSAEVIESEIGTKAAQGE